MIRALIVDDEPLSRRAIRQLLDRHPDVSVVGECGDGITARAAMSDLRPDVVFLDVRMPELSGLDLARDGNARDMPLIVFVTAYDEFALPAFETDAVDYVTKPVAEERFDAALDRVRRRLALVRSATQRADDPPRITRFVARSRGRDIVIPLDNVDYIEADDVYAAVHANGKRHLVRVSLDSLERALDPAEFLRIHRSVIVRVDSIRALRRTADGGREAVLASGIVLPVSRRRKSALDELMRSTSEPRPAVDPR